MSSSLRKSAVELPTMIPTRAARNDHFNMLTNRTDSSKNLFFHLDSILSFVPCQSL